MDGEAVDGITEFSFCERNLLHVTKAGTDPYDSLSCVGNECDTPRNGMTGGFRQRVVFFKQGIGLRVCNQLPILVQLFFPDEMFPDSRTDVFKEGCHLIVSDPVQVAKLHFFPGFDKDSIWQQNFFMIFPGSGLIV